jgi:hypothetical protein
VELYGKPFIPAHRAGYSGIYFIKMANNALNHDRPHLQTALKYARSPAYKFRRWADKEYHYALFMHCILMFAGFLWKYQNDKKAI